MIKCLNVGCGQRFHPDWVNLDLHPTDPSVREWDLRKELPFPAASFDVVYHSHVLEHFSRADAPHLLHGCRRVLKPGGVIRVVVPDLERIAHLYLEALTESVSGNREWQSRYDWAVLEMYDQVARDSSGGEMASFVQKAPPSLLPFLRERLGGELLESILRIQQSSGGVFRTSLVDGIRRKLLRLLIGRDGISAYDQGRFRRSGEVHRWMYDRHSLAGLLESVGFPSARKVGPTESAISGWAALNLDTQPDGSVYKPDSLYMEAIRP